jgi:tetratricopeptide (TPR) repeat protein
MQIEAAAAPRTAASADWWDLAMTLLFLGAMFALGMMKVVDNDTWTHLAFGRWIVDNGAIPTAEPFITTSPPFPYNNWLFGLVYYLAWLAAGIPGVVLLKATLVAAIFGLLLRDALRGHGQWAIALIAFGIVVLLVRPRFVERPDTIMMLALAFSLYALNAYVREGRRLIYALPLVHLLWANMHTSIALMVVPFGAFLAGGAAHVWLDRHHPQRPYLRGVAPSPAQMKNIAFVLGASFLASLVSPYFLDQYLHSAGALASDWWRQEITELKAPTWNSARLLYLFSGAVILSFVLNWRRLSVVDLLAAVPFVALPFTAGRFIWFSVIGAVFLVRNLAGALEDWPRLRQVIVSRVAAALAAVAFGVAAFMQAAGIEPLGSDNGLEFGLDVSYLLVPEGALGYLDRREVDGLVFNLFQWGGYMTWRDFPRRRPFIDGRGFLDDKLLEKSGVAVNDARALGELHRKHGFDVVLSQYPLVTAATAYEVVKGDFLMNHPDWALVYWDDTSLVYLRRSGPYAKYIAEDEYHYVKPAKGIDRAALSPERRERLLAEVQRNIEATGSSRGHYFLGALLSEAGRYREAIEAFGKVREVYGFDHLRDAKAGMAEAHFRLGETAEAIRLYEAAGELRWDANLFQKLGLAYATQGNREAAIEAYESALSMNTQLVSVYRELAALYRAAGRTDRAEELLRNAETAQRSKQGEEHFKLGTKAYLDRNYALAIEEYRKSVEVNPRSPVAYSNLAYVYYDSGDFDKALEYHLRAIDIDINTAVSHYGLALIYEARGDRANAIRHWEEYLRLEPAGYYTRRAKEHLDKLR